MTPTARTETKKHIERIDIVASGGAGGKLVKYGASRDDIMKLIKSGYKVTRI
jgi:hypothetical protein